MIGFCRRPVHRRRLPDRGEADPRVRADEARACTGSRTCGTRSWSKLADTFAAYLRAQGRGGRRRDPALRLLGRALCRRTTTRSSSRRTRRASRRRRRADHPLRHRHDASARRHDGGRRRRDRARLARPDRPGLGDRRRATAACRGISIRRSCSGPASGSRRRRTDPGCRGGPAGATSSTSGTACSRTRIPPISRAWSSSCTSRAPRSRCGHDLRRFTGATRRRHPLSSVTRRERARGARKGPRVRTAVVLMAYGSPSRARGRPRLLRGHPRRAPRRARRRSTSSSERYRRIGGPRR